MKDYPIDDLAFIASKFDASEIKNARIFITGAGSWFGTWITSFLDYAKVNWERWMKPYDRFPTGAFDYVIHLAQYSTRDVLRFSRRAQCKTFLFTSSGSLYNPDPDVKSNKVVDESWVREYGCDYRICRCYTFLGPGCPTRYAAGAFIHQALKGEPLKVKHDGSSVRTYLYIADLVAWLLTIMVKGKPDIYDVAGDEPITMLDLATRILLVTKGSRIEFIGDTNDDIRPVYVPDTRNYHKSRQLGLEAWTGIDEAIEKTVKYYE